VIYLDYKSLKHLKGQGKLVFRYELYLCHIPIKSDLLDFLGIDVLAYGLLDRVIKRFASIDICYFLLK